MRICATSSPLALSKPQRSRVTSTRSRARGRWHLALRRPALLRPNRRVHVLQQPVRTLALGPLYLGWGRQCDGFRSALDDFGFIASARCEHPSDVLNRRIQLFVRHGLERLRMLNFHLVRHKVTEDLHITERALLPTFLNHLATVRLKIQQERLEEFTDRSSRHKMCVYAKSTQL